MRERLRLLDGELTVRSEPGAGTTIVAISEMGRTMVDASAAHGVDVAVDR